MFISQACLCYHVYQEKKSKSVTENSKVSNQRNAFFKKFKQTLNSRKRIFQSA